MPKPTVSIGESSNGFVGKTVRYIGKTAHAADAPHEGVNALNAACLGLMGINALRETFREQDVVRVHPIITKGGDFVNSVPDDVRLELYVRAKPWMLLIPHIRALTQHLRLAAMLSAHRPLSKHCRACSR